MAKKLSCALTHARQESFFLEKWIHHYSQIVGRENLYVTLDGSDWTPDVDLTGVNVEVIEDAPRARIRNDRFIASEMSKRANGLRKRYRYVLRMDVDEFVVLDPAAHLDWDEALGEVDDDGYIFAIGIDVIQRGADLSPADRTSPILAQRPFGVVSGLYTKPFAISRWNNWAGGGHRLINRPVKISNNFVLFHLALADLNIAQERHSARGGDAQHNSFVSYIGERFTAIRSTSTMEIEDYDEVCGVAKHVFTWNEDGEARKRPPPQNDRALYVEIPGRFQSLL
ncbi:glycosyltransferase family 2 protein [Ostreiculturibacter nitratireducens]|uniref:glycosyltransferase family 2 protein n=1 Tax=Ostreiculturibacter nitratireducens TaxID=3075226 RepID=UPI0031B5D527